MIDLGKVNMDLIRAGVDNHILCPWCDGIGCDDEYCDKGIVKLKKCSGCNQLQTPDHFYGVEKKQSLCIPCYKKRYFGDYRRKLRERK